MKLSLVLTIALFHVCIHFSQVQKALSLKCLYCVSYKSWEECNKDARPVNCSDVFNACVKYHKVTEYKSGHQQHLFEKRCWHTDECSNKKCQVTVDLNVKGSWCEMNCCNGSLCNSGVTPWWAKHHVVKNTYSMQKQALNNSNGVIKSNYVIISFCILQLVYSAFKLFW